MKALRNPLVVTGLAVLAFGVAGWNVVGPMVKRYRATHAQPAAATPGRATTHAAPVTADRVQPTAAVPRIPIDVAQVRPRVLEWLEAPRRDPFQLYSASARATDGPRAADVLALKAIWRQTGGSLAVINGQVLGEGDEISGFKLERIEGDMVWVRGTNGSERIEFTPAGGPDRPPEGESSATASTNVRQPQS